MVTKLTASILVPSRGAALLVFRDEEEHDIAHYEFSYYAPDITIPTWSSKSRTAGMGEKRRLAERARTLVTRLWSADRPAEMKVHIQAEGEGAAILIEQKGV